VVATTLTSPVATMISPVARVALVPEVVAAAERPQAARPGQLDEDRFGQAVQQRVFPSASTMAVRPGFEPDATA
jgi:hypothetical protein